eukprot:TRINITY_DN14227_c0_g1_i1.p1 TRINITY_DN14227_c0_g1~~TRINITY_DN14227_c0_g1_i1.p1  ORF type:complete len:243 (-),score=51.37 TRINITY_DN14227_c0_g1_i1:1-702(-)
MDNELLEIFEQFEKLNFLKKYEEEEENNKEENRKMIIKKNAEILKLKILNREYINAIQEYDFTLLLWKSYSEDLENQLNESMVLNKSIENNNANISMNKSEEPTNLDTLIIEDILDSIERIRTNLHLSPIQKKNEQIYERKSLSTKKTPLQSKTFRESLGNINSISPNKFNKMGSSYEFKENEKNITPIFNKSLRKELSKNTIERKRTPLSPMNYDLNRSIPFQELYNNQTRN